MNASSAWHFDDFSAINLSCRSVASEITYQQYLNITYHSVIFELHICDIRITTTYHINDIHHVSEIGITYRFIHLLVCQRSSLYIIRHI